MEQEPEEFYERIREAYRDLAAREPKRIVLINGARDADEIANIEPDARRRQSVH